jgi:hypothetical protein
MGAADKAVDPDVEAALSAIRQAISRDTANSHARKGGNSVSSEDQRRTYRLDPKSGKLTRSGTSPEEIVELRNRISGHLDRITTERTVAKDRRDPPASGGFAGILGGETRLQGPPVPEPEPANDYDYNGYGDYHAEDDARFAPLRGTYRNDPQPAHWQEEPPEYAPAQVPMHHAYEPQPQSPGMLSGEAAAATQHAFNQLAETLMSRAMGERSVEEVTRELLRTMLKQWLDENLPSLVERLVREEIERVARRGPQR